VILFNECLVILELYLKFSMVYFLNSIWKCFLLKTKMTSTK